MPSEYACNAHYLARQQAVNFKEWIMNRESVSQEHTIVKALRHLKVGYVRKRHEDPKTLLATHFSRHASLNLTGDWLQQAGFPTGTRVKVTITHGQLIIELANQCDPS